MIYCIHIEHEREIWAQPNITESREYQRWPYLQQHYGPNWTYGQALNSILIMINYVNKVPLYQQPDEWNRCFQTMNTHLYMVDTWAIKCNDYIEAQVYALGGVPTV